MSSINLKEATLQLNALAPAQTPTESNKPDETGRGENTTLADNAKQSKTESSNTKG